MSISTEDFIKAIYKLRDNKEPSTSSAIADQLRISNAAVTDMSKKLSNKGLVIYEKYKELQLTKKGLIEAKQIIRRHRIWETFLHKVLGMNKTEIHHEAELLEHQTTDNLLNKLDKFLGYPRFDPHGDPIPDRHGKIADQPDQLAIADAGKGEYFVSRIITDNQITDQYLKSIGLVLGKQIIVKEKVDELASIMVVLENKQHLIQEKIYKKVFVTKKIKDGNN